TPPTRHQLRVGPMELSHDQVRWIAELARLELTDEEVALYAGQLSKILQDFQRLQELDTSQIEPTASVLPLKNILRLDVTTAPLSPEAVIANASDAIDGQFRVSAVLDE
ncbi:MAG TPA: Asp-tRNA(Asn)/Glu-tRNA(Gln) amidotransferase subunit GatC, partial [Phototrophicaceae bacterium]|nr:Asp-tRNA(Asn)/Glu-tRNA(Gln) amidotransferase subunit GatC [Phototrophicaceae bacterium]